MTSNTRVAGSDNPRGLAEAPASSDHLEEVKDEPKGFSYYGADLLCVAAFGGSASGLARYAEALEAFRQALRLRPNDVATYSNLASMYNNMGRHAEAAEAARQAIRLKPDLPNPRRHLGYAYLKMGRYAEAIASLKEAIRLDPAYAEAHHNLGLAYLASHNRSAALKHYRILRSLNPDLANQLEREMNE